MTNFKTLSISAFLLLSLIGCQVTIPPAQDSSNSNNSTNAKTLTFLDAKPLRGSEKVSVHAYAYTRGSDMCSRTIALQFASELPYTQTLIALRNRALVTGANALSITGWEEKGSITTLTAHFFDCHSKRGL